jgi:hypothetical protein
MMPTIVNEAVPVPPPAYYRAQERLGPALHIDALTLVNTLHLFALCRLAVRLACHRCPSPLRKSVREGLRERTAKHLCSSLRSCAHCGGSLTPICATGYARGPPLPWRAACRQARMDALVFRVRRSSASVGSWQELRCQKPSSFSVSWLPFVLG